MTTRIFEDSPAVRGQMPLLLGFVGPSGSGKTYSALRVATGIQKVSGGDIYVLDSEARRALHYADKFKFRHVPFGAPFSPLDYLEAIKHCIGKGAKIIITDSTSHEHEGSGGVLEMHQQEIQRLMKAWNTTSEEKVQIPAWAKPKQQRRQLINYILQQSVNFLFCFRAKEKLKIVGGKPKPQGFMPQAGEEFIYELMLNFLLLPGANGVPEWESQEVGEKMITKMAEQFRGLFANKPQLSEELGQKMAEWAAGGKAPGVVNPADLLKRYAACSDPATFRAIEDDRKAVWTTASALVKKQLKEAADATTARLKAAEEAAPPAGDEPPVEEPPPGAESEPLTDAAGNLI